MDSPGYGRLAGTLARARQRLRLHRDSEGGQTLVEFTLVLPFLLLLIFALVDFGRAYYTWQVVTNGAREGARAAAVQSDSATIDSKIYASFCSSYPSNCAISPSKLTITKTNVQGTRGTEATVKLSYAFQWVTPMGAMLNLVGGSSLANPTISSTSSMRLE